MGEVVDQVNRHFSVGVFDGLSILLEDSIECAKIGLGLFDLFVELADKLASR